MMTRAHHDLQQKLAATTGYHTVNNVTQDAYEPSSKNSFAATAAALEGLAEATQHYRTAVENLTTSNNTLTQQLKTIKELKT